MEPLQTSSLSDSDFALFVKKVKELTAIDLAQYKEAQMKRRLATLRDKKGYATFADFFKAIQSDKGMMAEFLDRMTINVSEFWRNPNRWSVLESKFIPELASRTNRLKCWSAACSTGEEPYTLAMILDLQRLLGTSQIIASDLDNNALARAKEGLYPDRSVKDVPPEYFNKYFTAEDTLFRISPALKRGITFERKNLLHDSYDSGFDLIICRNVMIYFTEEAKRDMYHRFAQALKPNGILFVGSTEQIFSPGQYGLESVDTFFYQRKA
ncbi:protein-glutamate O-methyltransferase CheR [Xylanibacillus composti]|uniref:protein-glutamate O-methyltransferase n=1 Tax=Xylanibacillus composti TaxID=1572762 RepID=A0A8J4H184_9BACL|nr:protein-glutamate O-methyltransferase CheR [Xylanibacillus composti]MDT9725462.1 protein-glutamate O-methyltransferase CheR [Xylanibacillus composti]GIQ67556.1 chemotaxis protein methyltransferase [Xylanibacillus composti]